TTRCSRGCCSSWTAPAPLASRPGSPPSTRPPGSWHLPLPQRPVLAASLADLLQHAPSIPIWRTVHDPDQQGD
ncbi:hypothetical protein ACFVZI_48890, partial [Streptomyces mirabilis]